MKNEIVLYRANELSSQIEVIIQDETVWLNRKQMAVLFGRDIKTIGKHINNSIKEELTGLSVIAKFATTASDGKVYQVEHYNLDVIISVGYRVKSKQGTQFRMWANKILKEFLLRGYAIDDRFNKVENKINALERDVEEINIQIKTELPPTQGIFYDGQVFDAYKFVSGLIKKAAKSIILIDNYIDESVFDLLTKKNKQVDVIVLTKNISKALILDGKKFNEQYGNLTIKQFNKAHDRFLIIDRKDVYHFGASLKDLGKKWFAFTKMDLNTFSLLENIDKAATNA